MARDAIKVSRNLDDNALDNVLFANLSDGTDVLAINADGSLNVTVDNASIVVTATDLDIRDLTHVSDSVKVGDGTDFLAVNNDGSINAVVTATDLDIRDLDSASDSVSAVQSGTWDIGTVTSITNAVTVTATDLDIRDLTHATDSVKVGDGTDFLAVNNDGSINVVVASGVSGTPILVTSAASLASSASGNHDYTAAGGAFKPAKVQVSSESIATFEILTGPTGTLVSRGVIRTSVEHPTDSFVFPTGFSIADTEIVRVIRTNDSNKTKTVNSSISGEQL